MKVDFILILFHSTSPFMRKVCFTKASTWFFPLFPPLQKMALARWEKIQTQLFGRLFFASLFRLFFFLTVSHILVKKMQTILFKSFCTISLLTVFLFFFSLTIAHFHEKKCKTNSFQDFSFAPPLSDFFFFQNLAFLLREKLQRLPFNLSLFSIFFFQSQTQTQEVNGQEKEQKQMKST